MIESINPYDQKILETFEPDSDQKVTEKINLAARTFKDWRKTGFSQRSELMQKAASTLETNKSQYAKSITLEMGKPLKESIAEIEKCAWVCNFYAENAAQFLSDEAIETDASESFIQYDPLGVILAVMPWNYPFWQVFRFAAPTLMAGNVGLLKHASNVSRSALNIEEVFRKAGFPDHCFQTLLIGSEKVRGVIENKAVKAVTLTGSEKAGASVASIAGKQIKKTVLELGGSNAFIVLPDADLDAAVETAVKARFQNTGQSCIAAKRFILLDQIAETFIEKFVARTRTLIQGDPMSKETEIGPMAREDLAEEIEKQVNDSIAKGAQLRLGGKRQHAKFEPTILTDVKPGMPAFDEELFGPVAPFTVVGSKEEALRLANQSDFGLGATVCTGDRKLAQFFIDGIEDGAVFVNELVKSDPRLPFGGTKISGYGRELSHYGIREFVNIKTVFIK